MINFASYFSRNVKNTLLLKNGVNLAHKGPWVLVYPNTVIDEWYVGDFMSAEYTVSVDFGNNEKRLSSVCWLPAQIQQRLLYLDVRISTVIL